MSQWAGGRALLEGLNPYDTAVWGPLRARYGSEWIPDSRVPFPLWTLLFHLPFSALDLAWGAAAWLSLLMMLLGFSIFLIVFELVGNLLPIGEFAVLVVGAFLFRGSVISLRGGQLTFVLLFILVLFWFLLRHGHSFWAGFVLAFIMLKPNPFILLAPLVGVWLVWRREWRVAAGGLTAVGLMFFMSWLVLPGWFLDWLDVRGKTEYAIMMPTVWGIAHDLAMEWWVVLGLLLAVSVTAVIGWLVFVRPVGMDETAVLSLAVVGSLIVTPYAWVYEHLLLLFPLIVIFLRIKNRWRATAVYGILTLILPWGLFFIAKERWGIDTWTILVPFLIGILFFWRINHKANDNTTR